MPKTDILNEVANFSITQDKLYVKTMSQVATAGNIAYLVTGTFSNSTPGVRTTIGNITLTTTGRPIFIELVGTPSATTACFSSSVNGALLEVLVNSTSSPIASFYANFGGSTVGPGGLAQKFLWAPAPPAGTYTFYFRFGINNSNFANFNNYTLLAYEL
jgi:hypothetical protein